MKTLLKIVISLLTVWLLVISFYGIITHQFSDISFWLQYLAGLVCVMLGIAYLKKH